MSRHRSSSASHRSGSGFKGIKAKKKEESNRQALPPRAIAIILVFILVAVLMAYLFTR